jgi:serine acetyltransferase
MASIGDRSTIGAGSVVVHAIPHDSVAVGAPARLVTKAGTGSIGPGDIPGSASAESADGDHRTDGGSGR